MFPLRLRGDNARGHRRMARVHEGDDVAAVEAFGTPRCFGQGKRRHLAHRGNNVVALAHIGDGHIRAQFIQAEQFLQLCRLRRIAIQQYILAIGNEEKVIQVFALRVEHGRPRAVLLGHGFDILRHQPLQKMPCILAGDTQHMAVGEDKVAVAHRIIPVK